jgi:hypothetical protein
MMKALNELNTFRKIPLLVGDLNNCYYADVNRYRNKQDIFDRLLQKNYSSQLRSFIEFYKN